MPTFLAKLVRAASPIHSRDRSLEKSPRSSRSSTSHSRAASVGSPPPLPAVSLTVTDATLKLPVDPVPLVAADLAAADDAARDSDSIFPVTVVPPSPSLINRSLAGSSSHSSQASLSGSVDQPTAADGRQTIPAELKSPQHTIVQSPSKPSLHEDNLPTPTVDQQQPPPPLQQPTRNSTLPPVVTSAPPDKKAPDQPRPAEQKSTRLSPMSLLSGGSVRKQPSNKSLKQPPPPPITITHVRASTTPLKRDDSETAVIYAPIVESPTGSSPPAFPSSAQTLSATSTSAAYLTAVLPRDPDSISITSNHSQTKDKEKKRSGWRRPSSAKKQPTGLASAIAASSLSLANHSLTAGQQAHFSAAASGSGPSTSPAASRKQSVSGSSPYTPTPNMPSPRHKKSRSDELSRQRLSPGSTKKAIRSATSLPRSRTASTSVYSDNNSEYYGDDRPEYYSGLEASSSDGSGDSDSEDDLMDLELGEEDIPVTGFAVASNKRNADFHEMFPSVPESDYLIDDYGCALQREILIQGRLYISEHHVCFHANIFGWITDLSVPINEITLLEKKMTAFVIPNGIQITTRRAKYTFASFLSRDTTFDVIFNIWKLERHDGLSVAIGLSDPMLAEQDGIEALPAESQVNGLPLHRATQCACGRSGGHLSETALEVVVPGTPERIHNLIFASGFMKDFLAVNQKLLDIQISDWTPIEPGSNLLARNMSYIKPLNNNIGPKQTKCEIRDETVYSDFDDYVVMLTLTRTPDVPSGNVFVVKTRTCIMWASAVSTRIVVTTQVEWTGRSFIKGIIEKSAIEGQKTYHSDLEKAMRAYIQEYQSEFVPAGVDPAAALAATREIASTPAVEAPHLSVEEDRKRREHERNLRGLQWAYETLSGAYQVAFQSTKGALELVKEAWEQSTTTTILYFVIVGLVISNIWTLMRVGTREEAARRKLLKTQEEREKLVHGVVTAIWDELELAKGQAVGGKPALPLPAPGTLGWREEVAALGKALDTIENRVKSIRDGMAAEEFRVNEVD